MESAIVTGAYGFIGSNLVTALKNRDVTVHSVTRDNSIYDIKDKVEYIFHCADVSPVPGQPANGFMENLDLTRDILHYWKYQQKHATLVGMNSIWAYPKGSHPLKETDFWKGPMERWKEAYGIQKRYLFAGMNALRVQYGMRSTMLTLGNVYGPGQRGNRTIEKIISTLQTSTGKVAFSAPYRRNFVFIEDQVEAIIEAAEWEAPLLNIAHDAYTIQEVVEVIAKWVNFKHEIEYVLYPPENDTVLDSSLARDKFHIWDNIEIHSLDEGIRKTLGDMG